MDDIRPSLIIEGGGMRGFFSAGVLQCLLDNGIDIDYVIGISSGSLNALGYVSGNMDFFFRAAADKTKIYLRLHNLFDVDKGLLDTERFFLGLKDLYKKVMGSSKNLFIGATRAKDAELVYFSRKDFSECDDMVECVRASAALPVLMPKVKIKEEVFVDGGIIDSVPIKKALDDGRNRNVLILTRPEGYRKKKQVMEFFLSRWLIPFPLLKEKILTRHIRYNETAAEVERGVREGTIFTFRPIDINLGRTEYNIKKFRKIINDGYSQCLEKLPELKIFLGMEDSN